MLSSSTNISLCGLYYRSDWNVSYGYRISPKPLEIQTNWWPFWSDFQWFGFRMVGTIAIATTDHTKTNALGIRTSEHSVFNVFGIPMFGRQALTVFTFSERSSGSGRPSGTT